MGELLRLAFLISFAVAIGASSLPAQGKDEKKAEKAEKTEKTAKAAEPSAEAPATPAVKPADFWMLEFHLQKVGMIQPTEGLHQGQVYWYIFYQIENKTVEDREAFVSIFARSDKSKTYSSIWAPDIEALLERKAGKPLWGKSDEVEILKERQKKGGIKAEKGTFNYFQFKAKKTVDCVAVFNKLDPGATHITITVEGLSNDIHLIEKENAPRQIESRIFVVELERPGDEYAMNIDQFRQIKSGWSKKITDLARPGESKKETSKEK